MPVRTRAARTSASSNEGREPLASDNDFTVVFQRVRVSPTTASPPRIRAPGPPPKPPVAPERPTPVSMAIPAAPPVQTVTVRPTLRVRLARVGVLLALGCTLGVGVERVVSGRVLASWGEHGDSAAGAVLGIALPPIDGQEGAKPGGNGAPASGAIPRLLRAHHHHVHHAAAAGPANASSSTTTIDAGEDAGDDMAAAMEALSKAKGEVTIP